MNGAVLIRWGANVPGRERAGMDVFTRAVGRFEEMTKQGRIHGHREYFSITGREGGYMLVEGETDELMKIISDEETLMLNGQASAIVQDFEVQALVGGNDQTNQRLMAKMTSSMQELGFM